MACIQRARYMNLLYALTTALRDDMHLATAYLSTKKGNRAIVQNAWDQKCIENGTKLKQRILKYLNFVGFHKDLFVLKYVRNIY